MSDFSRNQFFMACEKGDIKKAIQMFDVIPRYEQHECSSGGLMRAASKGHSDIVDLLIALDADLETIDQNGNTALFLACFNNHHSAVELLIENGADINHKNNKGNTLLIDQASIDNADNVLFLIKKNADVNIQNNYGVTALIMAAKYGYDRIIELLIDNGADISIKNTNDESALSIAQSTNNVSSSILICPDLLNAKNNFGDTPLITACREKYEYLVLFLMKKSADVDIINNLGMTVVDILIRLDDLPPGIQTLKEKLLLEKEIGNEMDNWMGL